VLRFWNNQVLHETHDVLEAIWLALSASARFGNPSGPHLALPRARGPHEARFVGGEGGG
jgi:hypothetical protein